jgi:hypothetical protein
MVGRVWHSRATHLTAAGGREGEEATLERLGMRFVLQRRYSVTSSSNQAPAPALYYLLVMPSNYDPIDELIHWLYQSSHGPVTSQ